MHALLMSNRDAVALRWLRKSCRSVRAHTNHMNHTHSCACLSAVASEQTFCKGLKQNGATTPIETPQHSNVSLGENAQLGRPSTECLAYKLCACQRPSRMQRLCNLVLHASCSVTH
jgi:hypothetical protein